MIDVGSPQFLFMAEAEGLDDLVTTRTAKIEAVINDVRALPEDVCDEDTFYDILHRHSLTELTSDEFQYVQSKI